MRKINTYFLSSILIIFMAISFLWNSYIIKSSTLEIVKEKSQSFFEQILLARYWNSSHGGVYVPVTDFTHPNPYLKDPKRDVITTDSLHLTKINPAYMTRQISEIAEVKSNLHFHITSLNPLRPGNEPDLWEENALKQFEKGEKEILGLIKHDSISLYRYMAPLKIQNTCLKCHAEQGYQLDDIRGGISISFPANIYISAQNRQLFFLFLAHLILLSAGLWGIFRYSQMYNHFYTIINEKNIDLQNESKLLNVANEALSKTNATKDKFFSIISHDLRGSFASILSLTGLMADDSCDLSPEDLRNFTHSVHKTAKSTNDLLQNLLDWSRLQKDVIICKPELINLNDFIGNSVESVRFAAVKKMINLEVNIPEGLTVQADVNMFQTIMRNLMMNAIKFTRSGGKVEVEARLSDENVILFSVKDSGIGMNKQILENLFRIDVNVSRQGTDAEPSTGLGLILCKEFVDKLSGKIWAESEIGKGSTFYFTIPKS